MTTFGTSAALHRTRCMKAGVEPRRGPRPGALRAVGSTGSPLSPEGFQWVYDELGDGRRGCSRPAAAPTSARAFVGGTPLLPVYAGRAAGRALGAEVEAFDEEGSRVVDEVGELVHHRADAVDAGRLLGRRRRRALPRGLLRRRTPASGATATGSGSRRAARRSSTAARTRRSTAAASAWARPRSTAPCSPSTRSPTRSSSTSRTRRHRQHWMPLFVVLAEGAELDDDVVEAIRTRIREDCSPRHVPDEVIAVAEVPRTLSGKVLEVPVKRMLMGGDPEQGGGRDSLANPEAFDWFVELRERSARSAGEPARRAGAAGCSTSGRHRPARSASSASTQRPARRRRSSHRDASPDVDGHVAVGARARRDAGRVDAAHLHARAAAAPGRRPPRSGG